MKKIFTLIAFVMACFNATAANDVVLNYSNAMQMYWDGGVEPTADGKLTIGAWSGIRWANLNLSSEDYEKVEFTFVDGLPANLAFEIYYEGDDDGTEKTQTDPEEGTTTFTMDITEGKTVKTIFIKTRDSEATIHLDKIVVKSKDGLGGTPTTNDVDLTYANAMQMYWDGGVEPTADGKLTIGAWSGIRWANLNLSSEDYEKVEFTFVDGLPANLAFEIYYEGDDDGTEKTQTDPEEGATTVTMDITEGKTVKTVFIKTRENEATIHLNKGIVKAKSTNTGISTFVKLPNNNGDDTIYTLSGHRVAKATKGLYIVNGKKIVVK